MSYRTIVADPPWRIGSLPPGEWQRAQGDRSEHGCPYSTMTLKEIKALPVLGLADAYAHLYLWTINEYLADAFAVVQQWGFGPVATLVWCKPDSGARVGGLFASNVEFVLFCRQRGGLAIARITTAIVEAMKAADVTKRELNAYMGVASMAQWWTATAPANRCDCPSPEQWERMKGLLPLPQSLDAEVDRLAGLREHRVIAQGTRWFQWPRRGHSVKPEAFIDLVEQVSPGPYVELFARRARMGWDYWGDQSLGTAEMVA